MGRGPGVIGYRGFESASQVLVNDFPIERGRELVARKGRMEGPGRSRLLDRRWMDTWFYLDGIPLAPGARVELREQGPPTGPVRGYVVTMLGVQPEGLPPRWDGE